MGQACKPLTEVDNASLTFELNNSTLGSQHYWRTLFPLKEVVRFTVKTIEGDEGLPIAARRVAFNSKNPLFTRKELGKNELKLGKYAASRSMDEIEIQDFRDLQSIAANSTDPAIANELVNMAYNDVRFCEKAMPAKIEIDALGIASLGKQTFPVDREGDMATEDEIDFNVPAENFIGAATAWTDQKNADGLKDIIDLQETISSKGFGKPMFAYMEKKAFNQLIAQEKTCKRLFPLLKNLDLYSSGMVNLSTINNYMDGMGYPHILVIDSWVGYENLDGSQENIKPWNENVVTLSTTPQLGWTYWKRKHIEDAEDKVSIESQGEFYNVSIIGERNPDNVITSAEGYAQVGLTNRRTKGFLNVAQTSWNGGQK